MLDSKNHRRSPFLQCHVVVTFVAVTAAILGAGCSSNGSSSGTGGSHQGSTGGATGSGTGGHVSTTGGATGSGGVPATSGGATGSGGSTATGGATGTGGGAGSHSGGATGSGGKTGGAGGGVSVGGAGGGASAALDQACTAACAMQKNLACADPACHDNCVAEADASPGASAPGKCKAQFTAMIQCTSKLAASKWICSSDENLPEAAEGECTTTVCAWTCCATDLVVTSDQWAWCKGASGGCP